MVKTPKMRHSKSRREPVTIELEPGAVSRIVDADAAKADASRGPTKRRRPTEAAAAADAPPETPDEPVHADQTDLEPWEHADAAAQAAPEQRRCRRVRRTGNALSRRREARAGSAKNLRLQFRGRLGQASGAPRRSRDSRGQEPAHAPRSEAAQRHCRRHHRRRHRAGRRRRAAVRRPARRARVGRSARRRSTASMARSPR